MKKAAKPARRRKAAGAAWKGRGPELGLAALVLGVVSSSLFYLVSGALADFSDVFQFVFLPPLVPGVAFLLWRYVVRARSPRLLFRSMEIGAWVVLVPFLYFVSATRLMRGAERIGCLALSVLLGALLWAPVVYARKTPLEKRIAASHDRSDNLTALVAALVVLAAALIAWAVAGNRHP